MWGRKKSPWPQELIVCPLELTVRMVACGIGTFRSKPYVLSLKWEGIKEETSMESFSLTGWKSAQSKFCHPCGRSLRCHTCQWRPLRVDQVPSLFRLLASLGRHSDQIQAVPSVAALQCGVWMESEGKFRILQMFRQREKCHANIRTKKVRVNDPACASAVSRAAWTWWQNKTNSMQTNLKLSTTKNWLRTKKGG